jgi:tRNA (guanosine-2'-O-)-methyltransferase
VNQLGPADLERLYREWTLRTAGRVALLLDGIERPANVAGILQAAVAFRVDHLYLAGSGVSPSDAEVDRLSEGAGRLLSWSSFARSPDAADAAREDGYAVVGLELVDDAIPLHQLRAGPDVCLAVGHEERGLSAETLAACDSVAFIPQLGRGGPSLGVAQATGIALYELRRQRWV